MKIMKNGIFCMKNREKWFFFARNREKWIFLLKNREKQTIFYEKCLGIEISLLEGESSLKNIKNAVFLLKNMKIYKF
jgi:hypothetical protein